MQLRALELKLDRTAESDFPLDPAMTVIPVVLLADRLLLEYIPPEETVDIGEGRVLFKPSSANTGMVTGRIVSIGDSCDTEKPIPAVLRKLGLVVRYTKSFAEEIEYEKQTYHMVRWTEVAMII